MTLNLDYPIWDADNHYYETRDCFTRHIEKRFVDKAIRPMRKDDGTEVLMLGDRQLQFPVVKFDACEPPGALKEILRNPKFSKFEEARSEEQMIPAFRDRRARLKLMDEQGVEAALLLPTMGVGWEQEAGDDIEAAYANLRSFNRWLEDDWGYGADGRVFAVPAVSLIDASHAVKELDRLLEIGTKFIYIRPAPAGGTHPMSPADRSFDPFWARLNEAEVLIVLHLSAGFNDMSAYWGENPQPNARAMSALQWAFYQGDRPIMETLGVLVYHNLFGRFPNLRILSIENGSGWLPYFLKQLNKGAKMGRFGPWPGGKLEERPSDIVKRHVWINPYHEEDSAVLVNLIGTEHVLGGSDYPHPEGTHEPIDFAESLVGLSDEQIRLIMRENLRGLVTATP